MNRKGSKTTGIEPYIIECMCLNISEKESLSYLKDRGYSISSREFYRIKNQIKESTSERLNLIASEQFIAQHLERIDMLKTIQTELWANYHKEQNPSKKANILMQIAEIQQFLSSYYDSTQYVMQQAARHKQEKNEKPLS
jgi:Fe2+ transport system protein B